MTTTKTQSTPSGDGGGSGKAIWVLIAVGIIGVGALILVFSPKPNQQGQQQAGGGGETSTDGANPDDDGTGVASAEEAEKVLSTARSLLNSDKPQQAVALLESELEKYEMDQMFRRTYGEALLTHALKIEKAAPSEEPAKGEAMAKATSLRERALKAYEEAIFVGTDNAPDRDVAANIASSLGDNEKAETYWKLAQKLDPASPKYPLYLAQIERRLNKNDAAAASLLRAVTLDPALDQGWGGLAALSKQSGRLAPALQHIQKAREISPRNVLYIKEEAVIRRRMGEPEQAATLLLTVDEPVRINDDELLAELALCYGALKEPERAVKMYERVAERRPTDAEPHFQLALWAERTGDLELALAASTRAYQLGYEQAIALVEQLRAELGT